MATLTPTQFVNKWSRIQLKESAAAQSHFNDVCALVGHPKPLERDPDGIDEFDSIHRELDQAVLDAYGWPHALTDDEILERLLTLNLQRASVASEV